MQRKMLMCDTLGVFVLWEAAMNSTNGKIAIESRKKMLAGLLKLMEVYDYREITVTQIVQEAGLSRNTFYRLFESKDQILALLIEDLFREFYGKVQKERLESFWRVMQSYFDFWEQKRELLLLLQKNHLLQRILDQSYLRSGEVFQFVHARDSANAPTLPLPYLLAFSVGGMHNMLIRWVEAGMDVPSRELIEKLRVCLLYDGLTDGASAGSGQFRDRC